MKNWKRSKDVVWVELNGDALLVNPATGTRWLLNAVAARIWKLCDGSRRAGELSELAAVPGYDIDCFCREFQRMGLLSESRAAWPASLDADACFHSAPDSAPGFRLLGVGHGSRRRPSPGGVSGPV